MLYITYMDSALLTTAPRDQGQEIEMPNITINDIHRNDKTGMVLVALTESGEKLQALLNTNTNKHKLYAFGGKGDACVKTYLVEDAETLDAVAKMVLES